MSEENQESKGLGDTVEKFTKATGIKKVVDKISEKTGKDCGCKKRKELLNNMFPYQAKKIKTVNRSDINTEIPRNGM